MPLVRPKLRGRCVAVRPALLRALAFWCGWFDAERLWGTAEQRISSEDGDGNKYGRRDLPNFTGEPSSLAEVERRAAQILEPELREHGMLNERVFNAIGEAANLAVEPSLSQVSQARKVATLLLLRMRDDLRCAGLLALRGYQLQACSLVASIYEATFTIAAIDSDDDLAQE